MREEQLFAGNRLKAADLSRNGQNITAVLTIASLYTADFAKDGKKRVAKFHETDKELVLNKTNWRAIKKMSNLADDDQWPGLQVELHVSVVEYQGDHVDAIRVRPVGGWDAWVGPAQAAAIQPLPAAPPVAPVAPQGTLPATGTGPLAGAVAAALPVMHAAPAAPPPFDAPADVPDDLPF